jgi:hypothetical protein
MLAACGRIGFSQLSSGRRDSGDLEPDSYAGPGTISLVVTGEGSNSGAPIAGADVLVDRSGTFDRLTTNEQGTVSFMVPGPTTFHVVYPVSAGHWRVYTIGSARAGGTVVLGGRPVDTMPTMTLKAPTGAGTTYSFTLGHCANVPNFGGPTMLFSYLSSCEGHALHVYAFNLNPDSYIDAGTVTLAAGTTDTITGTYVAMPSHGVHVTNLPAATTSVYTSLAIASPGDLLYLDPDGPTSTTPTGTAFDTTELAPPGGNMFVIQADGIQSDPTSAETIAYVATDTSGDVAYDASPMLPLMSTITVSPATSGVSWTPQIAGGVMYAISGSASNVQWTAYVDAGTDHVAFPVLPADLSAATPATWNDAYVTLYDVSDTNAATIVETIDHDPTPLATANQSTIYYTPF